MGIVAAWIMGWFRRKMFVEFDRSILVRIAIAEGEEAETYANWPILVGPLPFASFDNQTVPNVQVRDVVGFIVGIPRYIEEPEDVSVAESSSDEASSLITRPMASGLS